MLYNSDTIPTCAACDRKDETKSCKRCSVIFCAHFASTTDNRYCANCMSDFRVQETIMEKKIDHLRPDGTVNFSRKYQAKPIQLMGNDWLFASKLIAEMSDEEIENSVEYHKANVSLMLMERESRKLERYHKLAGIKVTRTSTESQEQREKREAKEAKKRTTTKDKTPSPDDIVAMLTKLATAGYTPEQLLAMFGGKK